jgi:hypothetical protein
MIARIKSSNSQTSKKKAYDFKVDEQLSRGMKPHEVEVIPRGRIDGAYEGKNAWDDILRFMAPHELDVSIVHVKNQNPIDMATLQAQMDTLLKYKNNPLCQNGFEVAIKQFLKGERSWLKHLLIHKA